MLHGEKLFNKRPFRTFTSAVTPLLLCVYYCDLVKNHTQNHIRSSFRGKMEYTMVHFSFLLYCIIVYIVSHSFSNCEFVQLTLKSDFVYLNRRISSVCVFCISQSTPKNMCYVYALKSEKCEKAVYILARLFAIYPELKSGKRLIDHSSRGKSYRNLYEHSGACFANWHLALMYSFPSFLLDSHRTAIIDIRKGRKCSTYHESRRLPHFTL